MLPQEIKLTHFQCLLIKAIRQGHKRYPHGCAYGKVARVFTSRYKGFISDLGIKSDATYLNQKYEGQSFHKHIPEWSSGNQVLGKDLCEYAKKYFKDFSSGW